MIEILNSWTEWWVAHPWITFWILWSLIGLTIAFKVTDLVPPSDPPKDEDGGMIVFLVIASVLLWPAVLGYGLLKFLPPYPKEKR